MRLSNLVFTMIETKRNWNKVHHIPIHRLSLVFQHFTTAGAVSFLFKCTSLVRRVKIPVLHLREIGPRFLNSLERYQSVMAPVIMCAKYWWTRGNPKLVSQLETTCSCNVCWQEHGLSLQLESDSIIKQVMEFDMILCWQHPVVNLSLLLWTASKFCLASNKWPWTLPISLWRGGTERRTLDAHSRCACVHLVHHCLLRIMNMRGISLSCNPQARHYIYLLVVQITLRYSSVPLEWVALLMSF